MLRGFASTIPRSTSSFFVPRSNPPMLSPACPSSSTLRNISTPVTTVLPVGRNPTIPTSTPPLPPPHPPPPPSPPPPPPPPYPPPPHPPHTLTPLPTPPPTSPLSPP